MSERTPDKRGLGWLLTVVGVLALLATGVGGLIYLIRTRPRPSGTAAGDPGRMVRVMTLKPARHQITVQAFGSAKPGEEWVAIAEVRAQVRGLSEHFERGSFVPKGTTLVTLDATDYELDETRHAAALADQTVRLKELAQQRKNLLDLKALRTQLVAVAKAELDSRLALKSQSVASERELDRAKNAHLAQRMALQELENQLRLLPTTEAKLQTGLELSRIRLAEARRNKARTRIVMPYPARCSERRVNPNQFVQAGEPLGRFFSLDKARVLAQVEARQLYWLFPEGIGVGPVDLSQGDGLSVQLKLLSIRAEVSWGTAPHRYAWWGKVVRMHGGLDPRTRTVGIEIEVADPYKQVELTGRPPLVPDMFCRVTLYGGVLPKGLLIPRDALRNDRVYLIREGKLAIVPVEVAAIEGRRVVIKSGLSAGDQVVLSDVFPAVEGMPLRPVPADNPATATVPLADRGTRK